MVVSSDVNIVFNYHGDGIYQGFYLCFVETLLRHIDGYNEVSLNGPDVDINKTKIKVLKVIKDHKKNSR